MMLITIPSNLGDINANNEKLREYVVKQLKEIYIANESNDELFNFRYNAIRLINGQLVTMNVKCADYGCDNVYREIYLKIFK